MELKYLSSLDRSREVVHQVVNVQEDGLDNRVTTARGQTFCVTQNGTVYLTGTRSNWSSKARRWQMKDKPDEWDYKLCGVRGALA